MASESQNRHIKKFANCIQIYQCAPRIYVNIPKTSIPLSQGSLQYLVVTGLTFLSEQPHFRVLLGSKSSTHLGIDVCFFPLLNTRSLLVPTNHCPALSMKTYYYCCFVPFCRTSRISNLFFGLSNLLDLYQPSFWWR